MGGGGKGEQEMPTTFAQVPQTESGTFTFTAAQDKYPFACRVLSIVWRGTTTAADVVRLRDLTPQNKILWEGQADGTNTYQGISYPAPYLDVKGGIEVDLLPAGQITVALARG